VLFISVLLSQYQIKTDKCTDMKKVEFNDARQAKDVFKFCENRTRIAGNLREVQCTFLIVLVLL
jgi:hypothetical protein